MKPIGSCIFVVYFLMIFASLVTFYVFVMPPGGSKMLAVDVSIGPYQWLRRSPSYHEVPTPVQLLLRLQNHHQDTQAATTTTPQTSLAMNQEEKKQVQSIIDQLKGNSLPDGGEIARSINLSSSEFTATNNRAHIVRQYESGSTASERKSTGETPDRKGITFSLFSLEDLRQYFVRKLIKAVAVCILLAIYSFCSKVSLHLRLRVRSLTQPSASQQVEIVERIPLSLSDPAATIPLSLNVPAATIPLSLSDPAATIRIGTGFCHEPRRIRRIRLQKKIAPPPKVPEKGKLTIIGSPPPKVPEKGKLAKGKGRVTFENLQQYFGHIRKDVAASLGVSVSTFKRMCRQQWIMRWPGMGSRVSKLPDQHGERNTSTACETPSHNVQTGMEVELFGQNGVANVLRQDFMVSRPPDQHGERNTSTACKTPSHNVENEMGCQNSKPNEFHPDSFEDLNFWNTDNGSIAEILSFLSLEEEPSLEGSVNLTVAACSDPAQCQHPMPTIPNTMTTTHMMPHLPAKGDMRFVTLKVTYGKKIMKFQFPLMSGIIELKEEVKKRLKLDAPENGARLVRANQISPIMLNSEKKDTSEGLNGECLTESVLSLDDLTKRKSFPDFDATENKAHLVKAYQSGPVVSLSENKNRGEALKRECTATSILKLQALQQLFVGRRDAAAKSFHAIYDPGLHMTDSLTRKSFQVLETLRPRKQQSNATNTDQERQIHTQMCHELSDACGAHPIHLNTYMRRFRTHLCPSLCHSACIRSIFGEQSNDLVPLLSLRRLALKGCVRQDKSPCFPRLLQINAVEQGLTQSPRYSGGLTAQSASSSRWPIGLQDGAHFVLLDPLKQSAKNVPHAARQDQCSLTVSLREKKMVRRTLKRKYKTISVIFVYHQQHIGRRCKGAAKSFGATCHCRKHGIRRVSTVKRIHKRLWIHRLPFRQKRATRKGNYLRDGRPFEASNLSMDEKLDSRLLFIHMSEFARSSPQPLALLDGGKIVGPIPLSSSEFAAANYRKHFVRQDQSGSTASRHEGKSARESLDRQGISMSLCIADDLQQRCGCKHKDAMKILGVNISMFKSTCRLHQFNWRPCWNEKNEQVFDARNNSAQLAKADQSGPTMSNSEKENTREALKRECVTSRVLSLENLRQHYGGRHKDVAKGLGDSLAWKSFKKRHELWFHMPDSLARKSFKVLDVLPLLEQSNSIRHLVPRRKLALKCWVRLKKSQDLPQTLQMKSSGGLTAQSASSLHCSINLTDGRHIVSVLEKKIVTIKTFKRKCRTMSVSFEDHNRHCGSRCKGAANSLGEKRMGPIWYTVKCKHRQHVIHRCPFRQGYSLGGERPAEVISLSMEEKLVSRLKFLRVYGVRRLRRLALPSGSESVGHIAFSSSEFAATNNRAWGRQDRCGSSASRHEKERTRETPNWEGIASHEITFEHLQQRFGSKREDVAKSLGISVSTLKRVCRHHGIRRWPNRIRSRVLRPPDPHGEKNPSPTSMTLSTNGQIMVENEMGCQNPEPSEFQPDTFADLNFRNTVVGSLSEMLSDWEDFFALEEGHSLEGHVSGSVNLPVAACSEPVPRQQPIPTIPDTMPTIHMIPHLECSDPAPCQHPMPTIPETMTTTSMVPHLAARADMRFVTLKVTYGKKIIKFQFPLMSGIIELKEEVKKRLKLELDSFDIEYKDEDGDCIFLGCDEDLRNHLQLFSNQVIRLLVVDSDANTANFR